MNPRDGVDRIIARGKVREGDREERLIPRPITILAIADVVSPVLYDHFQPERWRQVDLILSAGDLPPDYLDFLCTSIGVPILYVRGNHDARYEASQFDGCENVHGRIVSFKGLRIAGFEGCRRYNHGPCQYTEAEMCRAVRRIRLNALRHGPPSIILTHAPPAGCHDDTDPCHRGFDCFRKAIDRWKPSLFIHGHVHAYRREAARSILGATEVVNAYPYQLLTIPQPGLNRGTKVAAARTLE